MCLGKPRVDTAQMTARESLAEESRGTPFNTSSPFSLPPLPPLSVSLSFPSRLSFQSVHLCLELRSPSQPVCHKNIIQPGRHCNGETGLCQTGGAWKTAEPTSPHFCSLQCSQKSPVSSTVFSLNSEKPSRQQVWKDTLSVTHRLLLNRLATRDDLWPTVSCIKKVVFQ